ELKGQAVAAFVTLKEGHDPSEALRKELMQHVVHKIGAIARPDDILFSADLPKTRSGKIMRRLLKDIAEGRALGDTTTLADPGVGGASRSPASPGPRPPVRAYRGLFASPYPSAPYGIRPSELATSLCGAGPGARYYRPLFQRIDGGTHCPEDRFAWAWPRWRS